MPNDDYTPTTPGVRCAAWPNAPVLPIPADLADEPRPFAADHMHDPHNDPGHSTSTVPRHFCNGRLVKPDTDVPGSTVLLHTDTVNGAMALYLIDATGTPGNDLLTITDAPKQRGVTGTGEELADIARAILAYVEPPCDDPACGIASMPGECQDHLGECVECVRPATHLHGGNKGKEPCCGQHDDCEPDPMDEPHLPAPGAAEGATQDPLQRLLERIETIREEVRERAKEADAGSYKADSLNDTLDRLEDAHHFMQEAQRA